MGDNQIIFKSSSDIYYYNLTLETEKKIGSSSPTISLYYRQDDKVFFGSVSGLWYFNISSLECTQLYTVGGTLCKTFVYDQKLIIVTSSYTYFINLEDGSLIGSNSGYMYNPEFLELKNGNILVLSLSSSSRGSSVYWRCYLIDVSGSSLDLLTNCLAYSLHDVSYYLLDNGDLFFIPKNMGNFNDSPTGCFYFTNSDNTLKQLWNAYYGDYIILDNGQILVCSKYANWELRLFNPTDQTFNLLLNLTDFDSMEKQEDGTILIKTGTGIDYEYDSAKATLRLVYTATVE